MVPASGPADAANGSKGLRRWGTDVGDTGIHQPIPEAHASTVAKWASDRQGVGPASLCECTVLMAECQGDGFTHPLWLNAKALQRRGLMDDGRVAHTLDECAADAGVERGDQTQPQARQPRGQDRDRNHQTAQAALTGILAHDVTIGHPIRPADFEDGIAHDRQAERGQEVLHQVGNGDWLCVDRDPTGRNHDGEAFHEGANHVAGRATPHLAGSSPPRRRYHAECLAMPVLNGVPVAGVQETTIRTFMVKSEEEKDRLRPHIWWTKIPDFVHVYRGISLMDRVFFPTSAVCLVHPSQARRVFQRYQ